MNVWSNSSIDRFVLELMCRLSTFSFLSHPLWPAVFCRSEVSWDLVISTVKLFGLVRSDGLDQSASMAGHFVKRLLLTRCVCVILITSSSTSTYGKFIGIAVPSPPLAEIVMWCSLVPKRFYEATGILHDEVLDDIFNL